MNTPKPEDVPNLITKTIAISVLGILGIGVNSISNISIGEKMTTQMTTLNNTIAELTSKVLVLSERQDMINRFHQSQIDDLKKGQEKLQERYKR